MTTIIGNCARSIPRLTQPRRVQVPAAMTHMNQTMHHFLRLNQPRWVHLPPAFPFTYKQTSYAHRDSNRLRQSVTTGVAPSNQT